MAYVDTNVIVAQYAPGDPVHEAAESFLGWHPGAKVISPLTYAELAAVLARLGEQLTFPAALKKESPRRRVRTITEYFIRHSHLQLVTVTSSTRVRIAGHVATLPLEYHEASRRASTLGLRTLDLLHVSHATLISELHTELRYFVTADEAILARSKAIGEDTGLTVAHPGDFPRRGQS